MFGDFFKSNWRLLSAGAVLVLVLVFFLGWHNFTSPKTVWNDMLVNNLAARSVTKNQVVSTGTSADVYRVTVQFGPSYAARSLVTVRSSAGGVTTETLATPQAAFIRYTEISDALNKKDYSKLVNVWAKAGNDDSGKQLRSVFNQAILDVSLAPVPPIGFVNSEKRGELLDYTKNEQIFTPDYSKVKGEVINDRQVFTYPVTVKLAPYLRMMQEFGHVYGLTDLDSISADDYQSATVKLTVSADKLSHQMVRVTDSSTGLNETFTDYGVTQNIRTPTKTIAVNELQKRLQATQ